MTFTCLFLWGRASSWSLSFLFPPAKSGGSLLTALCGYWDNPGYDDIKLLVCLLFFFGGADCTGWTLPTPREQEMFGGWCAQLV